MRGGCAADMATATRILALPFRGILQIRHGASHKLTEPEPATRFVLSFIMVAGPPGGETSVREKRQSPQGHQGFGSRETASRASYRAMWTNVPSPWAHKHKTTPGTSLSTSESNRRTAQAARRPEEQAASANVLGHTNLSVFMRPQGAVLSHKQKSTGQCKCAMLLRCLDMRRACVPWGCRSGSAPGLHQAGPLL